MKKKNQKEQWIEEYEKEYRRQSEPYEQWIAKWEEIPVQGTEDVCFAVRPWEDIFFPQTELNPVEALSLFLQELDENVQYVILTGEEGRIAEQAEYWLRDYFETQPEAEAVYGDEDEWNEKDQKRLNPWFKPDWSPDTLHSCLYIGNMIAMRVSLLKKAAEKLGETAGDLPERRKEGISETAPGGSGRYGEYSVFWRLLLYLTDVMGVSFGHIDRILYHKDVTDMMKEGQENQEQSKGQSSGILRENCAEFDVVHVRYPMPDGEKLVSVIIPSKDHPELLRQCLDAIYKVTEYPAYEVIVVDNGSAPENQSLIRSMQEQMHFTYLYEEMEFNFSRMCNLGAVHAKGDILLFLNDDIEAQGKEWMTILAEQVLQPHTGAVGAKLYYPDSKIIQHTGVANMKIGPAHKLGGMEDRGNLYHGRNLADYNVLAVTAACMAVERKKYDAVGGFCEELAVAYNDVDICFSLYEKGYYNLIRNDVTLFHHESYSRGSDREAAKEKRLLQERKKLYQRHPKLYGKDPFYSRHLVQERLDADYHVEMQYEYEQSDRFSLRQPIDCFRETKNSLFRKLARKGSWNQYHLDEARIRQTDLFEEDSMVLELEGWCALTDRDMAEYERSLILIGKDGMAEQLEIFVKLRPDAAETLKEQPHGALCGFVVRIRVQDIRDGEYQVGYLFRPRAGGRPLVQYGEKLILKSTPELKGRTVSIVREKEQE